VMLSSMEAMHQVAGPHATVLSELNALWAACVERSQHEPAAPPAPSGPRP